MRSINGIAHRLKPPLALLAVGLAPLQPAISLRLGSGVGKAGGENVCVVGAGEECRRAAPGSGPGGFSYPSSVAVARDGDLYVADAVNNRFEEFASGGAFVAAFGWDVNAYKDRQSGASQRERNVCTAGEAVMSATACGAGSSGVRAGELDGLTSIAVDPHDGDIYTLETTLGNSRVSRFTASGQLVWTLGKGVNALTGGNLCTQGEVKRLGAKCGAGVPAATGSREHGAFKFASHEGNLLAVGGPEHLLYVGDEQRIQEFSTAGRWKREVSLRWIASTPGSRVAALAIDGSGDIFVVYQPAGANGLATEQTSVVRELDPAGRPLLAFEVVPLRSGAIDEVDGMALDSSGRLAVIGPETGRLPVGHFGRLYDVASGRMAGEFPSPSDNDGIAFGQDDRLYVAATDLQEILGYVPAPFAEMLTSPSSCAAGSTGSGAPTVFGCG